MPFSFLRIIYVYPCCGTKSGRSDEEEVEKEEATKVEKEKEKKAETI